jgi:hypothetical protein
MWKLRNAKNGDTFRFDEASTCMAVFEIMKREGYSLSVVSPDGTVVNIC